MPTVYVDGCSYNRKGNLQAGAGVVWLNNDPCPLQQRKLGPQSPTNWLHPSTSKNSSSVLIRTMPV